MQFRAAIGLFGASKFKSYGQNSLDFLNIITLIIILIMLLYTIEMGIQIWAGFSLDFCCENNLCQCAYTSTIIIIIIFCTFLLLTPKIQLTHVHCLCYQCRQILNSLCMILLVLDLIYMYYYQLICKLSGDIHENPGPGNCISICQLTRTIYIPRQKSLPV